MNTDVLLVGQVEEQPARRIHDGTLIATFRLITRLRYADHLGVDHEQTDYHEIEVMGELASEVGDLARGTWLSVRGRLVFTLQLDLLDTIEVTVLADRIERLTESAACTNLVRCTGALFAGPAMAPVWSAPISRFTVLPPRVAKAREADTWPACGLHGYALGGVAVEIGRMEPGAVVALQGHLRTNTRDPIDPTEVQSVALAVTAWG